MAQKRAGPVGNRLAERVEGVSEEQRGEAAEEILPRSLWYTRRAKRMTEGGGAGVGRVGRSFRCKALYHRAEWAGDFWSVGRGMNISHGRCLIETEYLCL